MGLEACYIILRREIMKKTMVIFLLILCVFVGSGCSSNETTIEVKELKNNAIESSDLFFLSPIDEPPFIDDDGYWMFPINMNNISTDDIYVDLSVNLMIFYQDGNQWYETSNRNVKYSSRDWRLPASSDFSTRLFLVNPYLKRDKVTFRVFVVGHLADENSTEVTAMIEYVIEDSNLIEIKTNK
jgi:hypothetical protein